MIAIQTFSLRSMTPWDALAAIVELGCRYVEPHWPPNEFDYHAKIEQPAPVAYGVPCIDFNVAENHKRLECATKLGVTVVNVDIETGAWPIAERMARDLGLKFAVHPHGPTHRIPGWRMVHEMTNDCPNMGLCLDTGHITRAGEDILQAVRVMRNKVFSVHLKDLDEHGADIPLGMGVLPLRELLTMMDGRDIPISIEWEGDEKNPLPGLRIGLEFVSQTVDSETHGSDLA